MSMGRRSPGRSTAHPSLRASHTHSEAAARTALSSASSSAGPEGSITISGAESSSATKRRSSISPAEPRTARGSQTPAHPLGKRAARLSRARPPRRRVGAPEPAGGRSGLGTGARTAAAGRRHRLHSREHEHLLRPRPGARVRRGAAGPGSRAPRARALGCPRRAKRTLMRSRRDQRPATGTGQPSSGSSSSPPGAAAAPRGAPRRAALRALPRSPVRGPGMPMTGGALGGEHHPDDGADREHHQAHSGHVQRRRARTFPRPGAAPPRAAPCAGAVTSARQSAGTRSSASRITTARRSAHSCRVGAAGGG